MGQTEYLVIVEKYGPSSYGAYVPELPGIGVAGETEDEVRSLVTEAVRLYLDELERDDVIILSYSPRLYKRSKRRGD